MPTYLYPQNLRATANLWLWSLRDFAILIISALVSVLILTQTKSLVPAVLTLLYGFLTIRQNDRTVLEYIRYAVRFFISTPQLFKWRQGEPATTLQMKILGKQKT